MTAMMRLAHRSMDLARRASDALRRNPSFRRIYYRVTNADTFGDLFWHDVMLADPVRVDTYARAIARFVQPGSVVVDLGTGLGVLACLAARRGARVYAVEHTPLIEKARAVARHNGLTNIEFVNAHSRDFEPPEPVDMILHEQIGNVLIDEDMVANVVELRDRVLKPGGRVLPARFSLYVDPVQLHDDHRLPFHWEQRLHGLDFGCLEPGATHPSTGASMRGIGPEEVERRLAPPQRVLSIDLETMRAGDLATAVAYDAVAQAAGRLDGFCVYFDVTFSDEIGFCTGPGHPRTHWSSRLLRTAATEVRAGDAVHFEMDLSYATNPARWTWDWAVRR